MAFSCRGNGVTADAKYLSGFEGENACLNPRIQKTAIINL
jgi:hypothetical protein